ncbi:RHS repeat-associated core domain-containing protein [Pseudomonas sp. BP8]|uniref:RHS repeat-associated core domain-containing protein n=1 Tax=Pseudomonas sp. BP8 TaxID=2817864 RepID=UPI001AEA063C|nr:RHS repeat-associated core domain-containing protein [Pseudomonas sp. BP8]MBP2259491.1 RHS repeat-associated protein [Pseudomonas sp. BP8]HDS1734015.1 hypothetical protein [Pseudomonas putida]
MSTLLFNQGIKLHTEITNNLKCSSFRTKNMPHAELRVSERDAESVLLASNGFESVLQANSRGFSQSIRYSPYGYSPAHNRTASMLSFNGERFDQHTGCYPLGNGYRLFSPSLQRFHSPDAMSPFAEGGVNQYAYCKGDPVNFVDPSGKIPTRALKNISLNGIPIIARRGPSPMSRAAIHRARAQQTRTLANRPDNLSEHETLMRRSRQEEVMAQRIESIAGKENLGSPLAAQQNQRPNIQHQNNATTPATEALTPNRERGIRPASLLIADIRDPRQTSFSSEHAQTERSPVTVRMR